MDRRSRMLRDALFAKYVVAPLVVVFLVLVFGAVMIVYTWQEESAKLRWDATVHNVLQQNIEDDLGAVKQLIGSGPGYEVRDFSLDYKSSGEIDRLSFRVQELRADGSCKMHEIGNYMNSNEYTITSEDGLCAAEPHMPLDQFLNVMTGDLIRGIAPQEHYDNVHLSGSLAVTTVQPNMNEPWKDLFAWDGSRLQGPLYSAQGYLIAVNSYHKPKIEGETGRKEMQVVVSGTYK